MAYCFDCEIATIGALCRSCSDHRADGHPPTRYHQTYQEPVTGARHTIQWRCHGAGPNGIATARLSETPRPLNLSELTTADAQEAKRARPIDHGTYNAFERGCRCEDCRTSRREYDRKRHAKHRAVAS